MTFGFVKDYIKHRLTAKKSHRRHSSATSKLPDTVIYENNPDKIYTEIEIKKIRLLPNGRRKGNRPKADQLLYRVAKHLNPKYIVEIGTGMGISKRYLTRAVPNATIVSLESDGSLKHATAKLGEVDFVFINYYEPDKLFTCFELLLPKLKPDSVVAVCTIYGSPLAKQCWQQIKEHPQVTSTVDLFWLQFVFFGKGQEKEHFRLRF